MKLEILCFEHGHRELKNKMDTEGATGSAEQRNFYIMCQQ